NRDARRAFGREVDGDRAADTAVAAGDHAMPLLETLRADVAGANDLRLGVHAMLVTGLCRLLLRRKSPAVLLAHRRCSSVRSVSARGAADEAAAPRSMSHAANHGGSSARDASKDADAASVFPRGHAAIATGRSSRFATRVNVDPSASGHAAETARSPSRLPRAR